MGRRFGPLCAIGLFFLGCQADIEGRIEEDVVVNATFVEFSDETLAEGLVPLLDGSAGNLEWGSADDPDRPYTFLQLSPESGFGDAGSPKFLAVKAAYTARFDPVREQYALLNFYLLLQWADTSPSRYKDALVYEGPDLDDLRPRVESYFRGLYGDLPPRELEAFVTDSLNTLFYTPQNRPRPENWTQDGGDDIVLVLFGDGDATDATGRSFRSFGLEVLEEDDWYGELATGLLDGWLWSATRTNPLDEPFDVEDVGQDVEPLLGFAGYAADHYVDTADGLRGDTGPALYIPNFSTTVPVEERVPLKAWRLSGDPNRADQGAGKCTQLNMGIRFPWLHRGAVFGSDLRSDSDRSLEDAHLINSVVFRWDTKEAEQARLFSPGDFISGYAVGHDFLARDEPNRFTFCLPGCIPPPERQPNCNGQPYFTPPHTANTLQARAKGGYDARTRHWVLEFARPLSTPWGDTNTLGNPVQDVDFSGLLEGPRDFYFVFAVWDEGSDRGPRLGTLPLRVHFEPPPPREE